MASKPPVSPSARRIPALAPLTADIRAARIGKKVTVADSADWLVGQATTLQRWDDFEDLGVAAYDGDAKAKAVCHHLFVVRAEMARQLWARHIFVGVSVLDDLLVRAVSAGESDPVRATLTPLLQ